MGMLVPIVTLFVVIVFVPDVALKVIICVPVTVIPAVPPTRLKLP